MTMRGQDRTHLRENPGRFNMRKGELYVLSTSDGYFLLKDLGESGARAKFAKAMPETQVSAVFTMDNDPEGVFEDILHIDRVKANQGWIVELS